MIPLTNYDYIDICYEDSHFRPIVPYLRRTSSRDKGQVGRPAKDRAVLPKSMVKCHKTGEGGFNEKRDFNFNQNFWWFWDGFQPLTSKVQPKPGILWDGLSEKSLDFQEKWWLSQQKPDGSASNPGCTVMRPVVPWRFRLASATFTLSAM